MNQSKLQSLSRPIGLGMLTLAIIIRVFLPENFITGFFTGFFIGLAITFIIYYFIKNRQSET